MPIPLASALEYLLRPGARHANDASTVRDLSVGRRPLDLPPGLALTWLGTAGFALAYEGTTIVIDPYVSRSGLRAVFGGAPLAADGALIDAFVPEADAVLVGHTHFDHALDIAEIARRRRCKVYGSPSAANLLRAGGLAPLAVVVEPGRVYEVGPFEITFIESVHSKLALGLFVPHDGELTCDHLDGLRAGQFRCGQVFGIHVAVAGVTFYHQGSANLLEDRIRHRGVDYLLAGISGRGFTPDYTRRVLRALRPRAVIPHHYDDFFRPLRAPMGFSLNVNFGGFVEEVERVSREFRVHALAPLERVSSSIVAPNPVRAE